MKLANTIVFVPLLAAVIGAGKVADAAEIWAGNGHAYEIFPDLLR